MQKVGFIKGLVHQKMKISLWFTHPRGILGVYDFLLSDESNRSYFKNCPGYSKRYHCSGCVFLFNSPKHLKNTSNKACASIIKHASHSLGAWINASCSESMHFCKKNMHISNVINTFLSLPLSDIRGSRSGFNWNWIEIENLTFFLFPGLNVILN